MTPLDAILDAFTVPGLVFIGLCVALWALLWAGEWAIKRLFGDWTLTDRRE